MRIRSLQTRITLGALLLSVIISAILSVAVLLTFEIAEKKFFEAHYQADISTFIQQYNVDPSISDLPRDNFQVFIARGGNDESIPDYVKELPKDTYNVTIDGRVFDYQIIDRGLNRYHFLFDEDDTDAFESSLLVFSAVISLVIIVVSVLTGQRLGRHIIQPLTDLAKRVSQFEIHNENGSAESEVLEDSDEIQTLERSIEEYHARISKLLKQEQEFSADVSHELRTPLMAMHGAAELLHRRLEDTNNDSIPVVNRITRGCVQMTGLTEALLYLAREPHNFDNLVEPIKVRKVVDDHLSILKEIIDSRDISVEVTQQTERTINAIPAVIDIVIGNIIKNAVKYTNQDLINISITHEGVVVQDYGPGIDEVKQTEIFDRYRRGDNGQENGAGIGLSLVKRFCDQYG
ncbi:MAG: HAMP domain-containing sensor histidine kinase, partial [Pseudomonadota bacterium]